MGEFTYEKARRVYAPYGREDLLHFASLNAVEVEKLRDENAKLRELATDALHMVFDPYPCGECDMVGECDDQDLDGSCLEKADMERRAERLGIEAGE